MTPLHIYHRVCQCGHPMSAMTPASLEAAHDDHDAAKHPELSHAEPIE